MFFIGQSLAGLASLPELQRTPDTSNTTTARMVADHWSVKAEYLYVNLPGNGGQTVATTFLGPSAFPEDVMSFASSRDSLNVVRFGVNYRFGGPVVASY